MRTTRILAAALATLASVSLPATASAVSFGADGKCMGYLDVTQSAASVTARTAVQCATLAPNTVFCTAYRLNGVLQTPSKCWWVMRTRTQYEGVRTAAAVPGVHEFCAMVGPLGGTPWAGACASVTVSPIRLTG